MQILMKGQNSHRESDIARQLEYMLSRERMDSLAVFALDIHID